MLMRIAVGSHQRFRKFQASLGQYEESPTTYEIKIITLHLEFW